MESRAYLPFRTRLPKEQRRCHLGKVAGFEQSPWWPTTHSSCRSALEDPSCQTYGGYRTCQPSPRRTSWYMDNVPWRRSQGAPLRWESQVPASCVLAKSSLPRDTVYNPSDGPINCSSWRLASPRQLRYCFSGTRIKPGEIVISDLEFSNMIINWQRKIKYLPGNQS
jgi:hypothetical protein